MPSGKQETRAAGDAVQWLQEEAHRVGTQVGKLEQQVGQLQALLSELLDRSHHFDASLTALTSQVATVSAAQEGINQFQTVLARMQQEQERSRAQVEETARLQQADLERVRKERGELMRGLSEIERQVSSWSERQASVEEAARRYQEAAAAVALQAERLDQRLEELESRTARNVEAVNRLEQRLPELEGALEKATRAIEAEYERGRLVAEVVRRIETELEEQKRNVESFNELLGRVELQRVERQRLETRASQLEEAINELRARGEEQQNLLSALDGKHHGYEGRLDALSGRLEEYREQLADYLLKLTQNQQQLKRRQINDLQREIKELEQNALGLTKE